MAEVTVAELAKSVSVSVEHLLALDMLRVLKTSAQRTKPGLSASCCNM